MPRVPRLTAILVVFISVPPGAAHASGFGVFQHGGRPTAQAGAFTARASDPSAVSYNPAAIVRLEGFQLELGAGLGVPHDELSLGREDYTAENQLKFPPTAYLTWRPARHSRWAFGLGLDSPVWHQENWPAPVPGGNRARFEVEVLQLHPVVAFAIDKRWSVGAGIRHLSGRLRDDYEVVLDSGRNPNTFWVTGERLAKTDVDGWAGDVSVSFRNAVWGFGSVFSSGAKLDGAADVDVVEVRYHGPPGNGPRVPASIAYLLEQAPRGLGIDLAPELRVGTWVAPDPKLRLELDVALAWWSKADWDRPRESPACGAPCSSLLPRDWRDTVSIRLGAERDVTNRLQLAMGVGHEPSPVPDRTLEPGVPQGDAWVFAMGASYGLPHVAFDVAYSFHGHSDRKDFGQRRYSSRAQVLAMSMPWRF